jgi:hypothetical protein
MDNLGRTDRHTERTDVWLLTYYMWADYNYVCGKII